MIGRVEVCAQPFCEQFRVLKRLVSGSVSMMAHPTRSAYRERCAHANNLNVLLQKEQFGDHQLQQIASTIIIEHVNLVHHDDTQFIDVTFLDGSVHQGICLRRGLERYPTHDLRKGDGLWPRTFSIVQTAMSVSAHVLRDLLPPKNPVTRTALGVCFHGCPGVDGSRSATLLSTSCTSRRNHFSFSWTRAT